MKDSNDTLFAIAALFLFAFGHWILGLLALVIALD